MRHTITWENGEEKVPGISIETGALTWTEPLPVVYNFTTDRPIFAQATEIRRENDGRITAEITWRPDNKDVEHAKSLVEHGDLAFSVWANELTRHKEEGKYIVTAGTIRQVSLVFADLVGWSHS